MSDHEKTRIPQIWITPPQLAKRWGVKNGKVYAFIESGELRAINLATNAGGKPRYRIDEADIAGFEARRAVQPPPPPPTRRKNLKDPDVTEYIK